jgi:hypothetical protein
MLNEHDYAREREQATKKPAHSLERNPGFSSRSRIEDPRKLIFLVLVALGILLFVGKISLSPVDPFEHLRPSLETKQAPPASSTLEPPKPEQYHPNF